MRELAATGVEGLDRILSGGLPSGSSIVVEGAPGTGKTTLGIQFLCHGVLVEGESGLYITFEEMPEQIYADMLDFGWDLKAMEQSGQLRVMCMTPASMLNLFKLPGSYLEEIIAELNCKRIVIDSINVLYLEQREQLTSRELFYSLRSGLRKFGLTALLLQEQDRGGEGRIPCEHYVADGVIRLAYQAHMGIYRRRTIEVLKMRGRPVMEGEHEFRFQENGIHVLPAYTTSGESDSAASDRVSTGFAKLDKLLDGGIAAGSIILLRVCSKANYYPVMMHMLLERLEAQETMFAFLYGDSSYGEIAQFCSEYGLPPEVMAGRSIYLIEHGGRYIPDEFKPFVLDVSAEDAGRLLDLLRSRLSAIVQQSNRMGKSCSLYMDTRIFSEKSNDRGCNALFEYMSILRSWGATGVLVCNYEETEPRIAAYLERSAHYVMETWVDGKYQYFRLAKSRSGRLSGPMLVEKTEAAPFVKLV